MSELIPDEAYGAANKAVLGVPLDWTVMRSSASVRAAAPIIARAAQIAILRQVKDEIVAEDSAWDVADRIEDMIEELEGGA